MTALAYVGGVEVPTSRIRLRGSGDQGFQVAAYADGSAAMAGVVFDDADGSYTTTGWSSFIVNETACTDAPRLFTGYIGDRTYRRGHYRLGAGREIDTTILDANILLRMHRINGADSLRPEETDTERLAWLLGSGYIPLVADLGLVNGADRVFEATQYKNQLPSDVLDDLIGPRGQIYFVYYDQAEEALGLFFDSPDATTFTSPLSISNVLSDVDNVTCFAPDIDATSTIDPSEVYSNVAYLYKGGRVYRQNSTTASTFFAGDIGHRDAFVENDRVGKQATAITFADRILARDSVEAQSLDLTVRLPKEKVGLIQAGHRLQVRLSFVPGFTSFTWTRVETWQAYHTENNPDFYDVVLHCSTRGKIGPGGGGDTGEFPHQEGEAPQIVQEKYMGTGTGIVLDNAPTVGNRWLLLCADRVSDGGASTPAGFTRVQHGDMFTGFSPSHGVEVFTKVVDSGDTTAVSSWTDMICHLIEVTPSTIQSSPVVENGLAAHQTAGGAVTATGAALVVGVTSVGAFDALTFTVASDSGTTGLVQGAFPGGNTPYLWTGTKEVTVAGSATVGGTISPSDGTHEVFTGITLLLTSDADASPPQPGQPVPWEVVTMSGADGNTAFPYASGSLLVKVDGVLISPASYTETIPDCGDFALTWEVDSDEVVSVQYLGR